MNTERSPANTSVLHKHTLSRGAQVHSVVQSSAGTARHKTDRRLWVQQERISEHVAASHNGMHFQVSGEHVALMQSHPEMHWETPTTELCRTMISLGHGKISEIIARL